MSSSFKHAVCSAFASMTLIAACDIRPEKVETTPVARVRHQLDAARNRVWLLTGAGVGIYDAAAPDVVRRVAVTGWLFAGEPRGCLPDLVLGPKGEAVVSSDVVPVLWRVDPDTLAVTRHELRLDADNDKDVGFTALSYSREQGAFFAVSGPHGTVWRIDLELRNAQKMPRQVAQGKRCAARVQF